MRGRALVLLCAAAVLAGAGVARAECLGAAAFPGRLSETGCYADLARRLAAPGMVAYDLASPLWTDGTHKRRWLALPAGTHIRILADGRWRFPHGSVLMKEFAHEERQGQASSRRPIETRLMRLSAEGWQFRSYRWDREGNDAVRVDKNQHVTLAVGIPAPAPNGRPYLIPGPRECTYCHNDAAGMVLGPSSAQLDFTVETAGRTVNQVDHLARQGIFATGSVVHLPRARVLPDPADTRVPLERRARSYLHAQCAHCHQPGGWAPPALTLDLRYEVAFPETKTCGIPTQYFVREPRIDPGSPGTSALWRRIVAPHEERMPPLGVNVTDPMAIVVRDFIAGLARCP